MASGGKDFFQVKMLRDINGPTIFKKRGDVMITESLSAFDKYRQEQYWIEKDTRCLIPMSYACPISSWASEVTKHDKEVQAIAERERKEAAERAERERIAAEARRKAAAERAERERIAAEARRKAAAERAERERIAAEARRKAAAEAAERQRLYEVRFISLFIHNLLSKKQMYVKTGK
jgi:hypothetical protein